MIYGDSKVRNMYRSVLPSKWGVASREKARVNRRYRRNAKMALSCAWDDDAWEAADIYQSGHQHMSGVVSNRRDADKTAPLIAWACAKTAHLPVAERFSFISRLIPKTMMGRHALVHIQYHRHFTGVAPNARRKRKSDADLLPEMTSYMESLFEMEDGFVNFNRNLREGCAWVSEDGVLHSPRLLKSRKDIPAFLENPASRGYVRLVLEGLR